jgi:hypothetical protein
MTDRFGPNGRGGACRHLENSRRLQTITVAAEEITNRCEDGGGMDLRANLAKPGSGALWLGTPA